MKKPAVIVIDMLQDFLRDWDEKRRQYLVNSISELLDIARSAMCPVIWVRQEFEPDLRDAFLEMKAKGIHVTVKGTPGCQIIPELAVGPSDTFVIKKRYSAFFKTNLDEIIDRLRPDALILAGINTHACIRTTAIDAYQRDLHVVIASDCVDSYDREHHDISLRYMRDRIADLMSNEEIRGSLQPAIGL
jgi:nicotinamidase-related amidase